MLAVVWNVCTPRPTLSWANAPACFDFDERKVVEGRTHAGASQLQKLRGRLVSVERGRVWKRGSREREPLDLSEEVGALVYGVVGCCLARREDKQNFFLSS